MKQKLAPSRVNVIKKKDVKRVNLRPFESMRTNANRVKTKFDAPKPSKKWWSDINQLVKGKR